MKIITAPLWMSVMMLGSCLLPGWMMPPRTFMNTRILNNYTE